MFKLLSLVYVLSLVGSDLANAAPDNARNRDNDHRPPSQEARHETRLPQHYRQDRYVVQDWRQRQLQAPPRGYHWVRNGDDDIALVSIQNGQISLTVRQNQYRYSQNWNRGQRLDREYQRDRYVVKNWRAAHLRNPGRGHHWVETDQQFILISTRSGIIYETNNKRR